MNKHATDSKTYYNRKTKRVTSQHTTMYARKGRNLDIINLNTNYLEL